jgi:hypothetical protein
MRLFWRPMAALALCGSLAACATPGSVRGTARPSPSPSAPATMLTITVAPDRTARGEVWTVSCQPVAGTHPKAAAACAFVARTPAQVLAPVPANQMCSMIFGGPQVATVRGTWHGTPVDARLTRDNGCEIARWNKLRPLIGDGAA